MGNFEKCSFLGMGGESLIRCFFSQKKIEQVYLIMNVMQSGAKAVFFDLEKFIWHSIICKFFV